MHFEYANGKMDLNNMVNNMKNKLKYLPVSILTLTTVLAGTTLAGSSVSADTTASRNVAVTVGASCNFDTDTSYTSSLSLISGNSATTEGDSTKSISMISCTGFNGFKIHAVGYSPTASSPTVRVEGATDLYGAAGTIPTGTAGPGSYWGFKIGSVQSNTGYTIASSYGDYSAVPSTLTEIVSYNAGATPAVTITGQFRTDYKVSTAISQPTGTYTGGVKYVIVTES